MRISERAIREAMEIMEMMEDWNRGHISDDDLTVHLLADAADGLFAERELSFE